MDTRRLNIETKQIHLFYAIAAGFLLIFLTDQPVIHLAVIWSIVIFAVSMVRFDLVHPYFWFSGTCALYNTAYTISYMFGYDRSAGYSSMNSIYALIALATVLLIVTPRTVERIQLSEPELKVNPKICERAYLMLALVLVVVALILRSSGYTGKREMQKVGDSYYYLGMNVIRWMMTLMILLLADSNCEDRRKNLRLTVITFGAALMMSYFTAERDIIFRASLLIICTFFYFGKVKRRQIIWLLPCGALMMIISVSMKYYFFTGYMNTSDSSLLARFLGSDFGATGRNTQYLINNDWTKGYYGISLFFSELVRGILPVGDFINPSKWYNYDVYPGSFKGQAFTYVGFGHIIGGLPGVIFVHIIMGMIVRALYRRSSKGIYSLVFYLYSITVIMGSFRQTINTIINISFKSVLLVFLFSMAVSKVSFRADKRRRIEIKQ